MSVTVRDVLALPCMRGAEVVAGKSGLDNVVTAVSVLEYSSYSDKQEQAFDDLHYEGSDITITAFSSLADRPGRILAEIQNSHSIGEAGVIIYYFDLFVKQLDKAVIDYADEVGYPIIVMPRDQFQLRYSVAIAEIQGLIINDQSKTENFTPFISETFVSLPKNQQNAGAFLRLLSNYLHVSFILTENDGSIRAFAGWPGLSERDAADTAYSIASGNYSGAHETLSFDDIPGQEGRLIVLASEDALPPKALEHINESARLVLRMIARETSEPIGAHQLIRAIIGDEPVKMRRIARNLGLETEKLRNMIIYRNSDPDPAVRSLVLREVKELFGMYCKNMVAESFSDDVVAFLDDGVSSQWLPTLISLNESLLAKGLMPFCVYARNLESPAEVRNAYINVTENLDEVKLLYPKYSVFSYHEILYVKACKELISGGEEAAARAMEVMKLFRGFGAETGDELAETLASFYFDSHSSTAETAANLNVHVNTVKYRLRKISDILGCKVTDMPEMAELYRALALDRLMRR